MKSNQYLFNQFKNLLEDKIPQKIKLHNDGKHLAIVDTDMWFSVEAKELTIGFGLNHIHYNFDYSSMEDAIDIFFLMLTKRKKVTNYSKGSSHFKTKVEIETETERTVALGTTTFFPLQFWKRTTSKLSFEDAILNTEDIIEEWRELIKNAEQLV